MTDKLEGQLSENATLELIGCMDLDVKKKKKTFRFKDLNISCDDSTNVSAAIKCYLVLLTFNFSSS